MSLNEQIKNAASEADITALLAKGETYAHASDRTRARWKRTAKLRIQALQNSSILPDSGPVSEGAAEVVDEAPTTSEQKVDNASVETTNEPVQPGE